MKIIYWILILLTIILVSTYYFTQKNNISDCAKYGGIEFNNTECNKEVNRICYLPFRDTCYVDDFENGKCKGMFGPKVLCDTYKPN